MHVVAAVVELLLLRKHDFDTVLKATIMKEWTHIKKCLLEIPYFEGWSAADIQDICMQSKILNFADGETILGNTRLFIRILKNIRLNMKNGRNFKELLKMV